MQQHSLLHTFSICQGYFAHDISTFQISYKFISSNKFEVQVQQIPYLRPSSLKRYRDVTARRDGSMRRKVCSSRRFVFGSVFSTPASSNEPLSSKKHSHRKILLALLFSSCSLSESSRVLFSHASRQIPQSFSF